MTVDAREKVSAAIKLRNRESQNSFRQAVDRNNRYGRPYEDIWFRGEQQDKDEAESPRNGGGTAADEEGDGGQGGPNIDTRLLSSCNGPIYANASLRTEVDRRRVTEGSYDNLR